MSGPQKQGRPPCDRFSQYQDDAKSAFGTAPTGFWGGGGCSQPTHSQPLRLATVGEPRYSCAVTSTQTPDLNSNAHTVGRGQELGLYNALFAEIGVTCDVLEWDPTTFHLCTSARNARNNHGSAKYATRTATSPVPNAVSAANGPTTDAQKGKENRRNPNASSATNPRTGQNPGTSRSVN